MGEDKFSLTLKCDLSGIGKVVAKMDSFGKENYVPEKTIYQITLVIDELLTNVMSYAFTNDRPQKISISAKSEKNLISVWIEDNGVAFNPLLEAKKPDLESDLDNREIGGLGIHIAKVTMDEISYQRTDDMNQIHFQKSFEATNA